MENNKQEKFATIELVGKNGVVLSKTIIDLEEIKKSCENDSEGFTHTFSVEPKPFYKGTIKADEL